MAASSRLPVALLGSAVLILGLVVWKPWSSPRPSAEAPAPAAAEDAIGAAPAAAIGEAPQLTPQQQQAVVAEKVRSAAPKSQAPETYTGPDGKQQQIVYNQGLALSAGAREELKKLRLQQMREQPEAISKIYGIGRDEIAAVLAGKQAFPDRLIDQ